uniref:Cytochrome c oxidase subunit 2 n=1 Tax=Stictocephala bisonia TaxID=1585304 RepID=A0A894JGJ0_9HEMI|nr:cytochrome c oxidase subunit II [Stictocephala bisonia]QRV59919.1 cytochrome c oxidase subunit II [Stictocephala bisonia]
MNTWMKISFQDACSPNMEQLILFNDHAMMIIIMITMIVGYMMLSLSFNKLINRMLLEGQMIELIWTIAPAVMLIFIAMPSLRILYLIEESLNPMMTVKSIGHQWFWSYEYSDFKNIEFDSYMKASTLMELNEFRLLDVDNRMIMPFNTPARILASSVDVIHSWTVPSMGIKIDASPGRINQANFMSQRPGIFYGQCSEICGSNHSFMPIVIESVNLTTFIKWLNTY